MHHADPKALTVQRAEGQAEDRARHRESVLAWLARNGYGRRAHLPPDVARMVRDAGLEPQEVTMQTTTEIPAPKAAHNGNRARRAAPGLPIELVPVDAPPPSMTTATGRWQRLIPQLQAQPGQWFDAGVHSHGGSETLRRKGVEVAKRGVGEPGRCRVYVRWPAD